MSTVHSPNPTWFNREPPSIYQYIFPKSSVRAIENKMATKFLMFFFMSALVLLADLSAMTKLCGKLKLKFKIKILCELTNAWLTVRRKLLQKFNVVNN